jgi:amino-acid N-acetyltransferase
MENPTQFVQWLRSVAPYIHAFRGKTFVVAFPGELVAAGAWVLAHDLSLLHALDINVTVVYGSRPQVAEQLALRNVEGRFHNGVRITDSAAWNAPRKPPANCASISRPRSARACRTRRCRMRPSVSFPATSSRPVRWA